MTVGQSRTEGRTLRRLVRVYRPIFSAISLEMDRNRHALISGTSPAYRLLRDSALQAVPIIAAQRNDAFRYGRNRIARLYGDRTGKAYDDPQLRLAPLESVQRFISRVERDIRLRMDLVHDEESVERTRAKLATVVDHELLRLARLNATLGESAGAFKELEERSSFGKKWTSREDEKVRISHQGLHGACVPLYDPFDNGLMHPGDMMRGTPRDWMNCRCWIVPATREDVDSWQQSR